MQRANCETIRRFAHICGMEDDDEEETDSDEENDGFKADAKISASANTSTVARTNCTEIFQKTTRRTTT